LLKGHAPIHARTGLTTSEMNVLAAYLPGAPRREDQCDLFPGLDWIKPCLFEYCRRGRRSQVRNMGCGAFPLLRIC
jgi:hypothetical protein